MKPSGLSSFFPLFAIVLMSLAGCVLEHHDPWEDGNWGAQQGQGGSSGSQPPGSIGSPCTRDNDCGAGCYCTRDGRVCRHSGHCQRDEHCASGFRCDERRTCVPRDSQPILDGGRTPEVPPTGGTGGAGGSSGKDAGVPEVAPEAPVSGTGGTGGSGGGVAPTTCRVDAQCGGGRCVQGGCQRPCGADTSCGTGHVCKEGFCQPSAQPGGQCVYSAECPSGGTCINGYCHAACPVTMTTAAMCPNPADRCLQGICKPDVRPVPQCTANAHCPAGRTCVDAVCRTPCKDDSQCGPGCSGTVCHAGYCVMPEELQPPPMCPMPCASTTCCPVQ